MLLIYLSYNEVTFAKVILDCYFTTLCG